MVDAVNTITPALPGLFVAILLAACSSSLEEPMENEVGCTNIREALNEQCTGADQIKWLNCDTLPGCPQGQVEGKDVDLCVSKISGSATCETAKQVSCAITKLNCAAPSETYANPMTFTETCDALEQGVQTAAGLNSCTIEDGLCDSVLSCQFGLFDGTSVETCVTSVSNETGCTEAQTRAKTCEFTKKYCGQ